MTDNTVKTLSKVGDLFVVAGGSPASQDKPLPEVAKEFDVRYVLQGGVQQSGDSGQDDRHTERCRRATRPCGPKTTSVS